MKNVTRMVEDEVYVAQNELGHEVRIDMRKGELKKNQSPVELLLSAVGACGAMDIVLMLKKRRKTVIDFITETEGTRKEDHPRSFTKVHCHYKITSPDITEDELYKIAKLSLEKYCSVADSLKTEVTLSVEVVQP
ncbi:MAG TPA: OsmC family protein [Cyclobacteriaceae bacterium]|nr:OsmC family protein [Cyclobacteriaceae bacterium]